MTARVSAAECRRVNHWACACGWTAKKAGFHGWESRCRALDKHLKENHVTTTRTCKICSASWKAPVSDCPVCTDPAVVAAVQVLTGYGIDGRKYDELLKLSR